MSVAPAKPEGMEKKKKTPASVLGETLFDPKSQKVKTAYGECRGRIAFKPKGSYGFGFDPIFMVDGTEKNFAQLTLKEKNQISHRAKALRKMKKVLLNYIRQEPALAKQGKV